MTDDTDCGPVVTLSPGLYPVAESDIACIVTSLEMVEPPAPGAHAQQGDWTFTAWHDVSVHDYQTLFREIGQDWLWSSRLLLSDKDLNAILRDPLVMLYRLKGAGGVGMLELDFRQPDTCELAFLGLTKGLIGAGAGRWLMARAIELAWSRPIQRLWVHTCTLDHPGAVDFYTRSGFKAYRRQVEIMPDPRQSGVLPQASAPHVPLLLR